MRIFERMQFAATLSLAILSMLQPENVVLPFIQDSIAALIVAGSYYEGLRLPHQPFVLTFIVEQLMSRVLGLHCIFIFYSGAFFVLLLVHVRRSIIWLLHSMWTLQGWLQRLRYKGDGKRVLNILPSDE